MPTISFGMDLLREADIIVPGRGGTWTHHRLSPNRGLKVPSVRRVNQGVCADGN